MEHSVLVNFDFSDWSALPTANVSLITPQWAYTADITNTIPPLLKPRLLQANQGYDVEMFMTFPDSHHNRNMGMVTMRMDIFHRMSRLDENGKKKNHDPEFARTYETRAGEQEAGGDISSGDSFGPDASAEQGDRMFNSPESTAADSHLNIQASAPQRKLIAQSFRSVCFSFSTVRAAAVDVECKLFLGVSCCFLVWFWFF